MSALRLIACGMVELNELTPDQRSLLQRDARTEAHSHGYWISGCSQVGCCGTITVDIESTGNPWGEWMTASQKPPHRLTRWSKNTRSHKRSRRPGISDRLHSLASGSFADCCAALVKRITPLNHENISDRKTQP